MRSPFTTHGLFDQVTMGQPEYQHVFVLFLKTMLGNRLKLRKQGGSQQDFFFSIYSYTWNSKLGNTINGLMIQSVAQKEFRHTQVNGGACVGSRTSSKALRLRGSSAEGAARRKLASCRDSPLNTDVLDLSPLTQSNPTWTHSERLHSTVKPSQLPGESVFYTVPLVPLRADVVSWQFPDGIPVQLQTSAKTQWWQGHSLALMSHFIQMWVEQSRNPTNSTGAELNLTWLLVT